MRIRSITARLGAALAMIIPALGAGGHLFARAGHTTASGGRITVAFSYDVATLDPSQTSNPPDDGIIFNLDGPHVASLGWTPSYNINEWAYAQRR